MKLKPPKGYRLMRRGARKDDRRLTRGMPDVFASHSSADINSMAVSDVFVALEFKSPKGKLTKEQSAYHENGVVTICRSVGEALEACGYSG